MGITIIHIQVKLPKADSETTQRTVTTSSQTTAGKQLCLPSTSSTNDDENLRNNDLIADVMSSNRFHDDRPEYYRDGSMTWCRQRFDVRGYDAADISVRVEANRKLIVCARHVESADETGSRVDAVTRQMSKTVDVPRGVRPHCITSYFAGDGFLTVVAPVDDDFDVNTSSDTNNSADPSSVQSLPRDCEFRPIQQKSNVNMQAAPPTVLELEADNDVINSASRNVVRTGKRQRFVSINC
jgi:Hsp20/alpha crystallin family